MSQAKGEHGTCPTKLVRGVRVNADVDEDGEETSTKSSKAASSAKSKPAKESKAERKARLKDEKDARKAEQDGVAEGGTDDGDFGSDGR